ncbi:MobA/MobL family protein, partial [Sulfitobacter sp. TMED3]|uniref:MobA/MobL family protein n=1 Tax=Sulfitobacter sp. TMED3 TaxID=1986591 RepID=UPI00338F2A07
MSTEYISRPPHKRRAQTGGLLLRYNCKTQPLPWANIAPRFTPGREGDERNHHAHILLTTRELDAEGSVPGGGFTTKNRDWNKVEVLEGWREAWARDSNAALERAGIEDRVDHRTLVAQRDEALELASAARERGDEG